MYFVHIRVIILDGEKSINIQSNYTDSAQNSSHHQTFNVAGLNLRFLKRYCYCDDEKKRRSNQLRASDETGRYERGDT